MTATRALIALAAALTMLTASRHADAQSLGTFRWQLQPFCNVIIVNVTQSGAVYTLDGYDDQCGAPTRAPLVGLATPNPDGTIGFGLQLVTTPSATPVAVRASITLAALGGAWSDSAGNSGTMVFNGAAAGSPRPTVVPAFPAGLAAGGARVTNVGSPTQASDAANKDYVDTRLPAAFTFQADGGFAARGTVGVGAIPATGPGRRMMWFPAKAAFRAGVAEGTEWNDMNIGTASFAVGRGTTASGFTAAALGYFTVADGDGAVAAGWESRAFGNASIALGYGVGACDNVSVALGSSASTSSSPTSLDPCGGTAFPGAFVYANGSGTYFTATAANEFAARAVGGFRLRTNVAASTGCNLAAGSGTWTCTSDRNQKQHFEAVDGEGVLAKLAAMPIDRWSYRSEPGVRHVGPTAQDFRAAFGLGVDDTSIGHIDLSGISLRAIQALDARTRPLADELAELRAEIAELRRALAAVRER